MLNSQPTYVPAAATSPEQIPSGSREERPISSFVDLFPIIAPAPASGGAPYSYNATVAPPAAVATGEAVPQADCQLRRQRRLGHCWPGQRPAPPWPLTEVLGSTFLFLEAQRGGAIEQPDSRIPWRRNHLLADGEDVGRNLTGGHYEAGSVHSKVSNIDEFASSQATAHGSDPDNAVVLCTLTIHCKAHWWPHAADSVAEIATLRLTAC